MNTKLDAVRTHLRGRLPDVITDLRARAKDHTVDGVRREAGYTIRNAAGDNGDEAVIRIYDEIWWLGVNALDLVSELDQITAPRIRVEINSPGGDVFDGIAIYNALRNHPATVTTRVDGIAASIASVIFQAGDRRVMQPAGQMMIHNAWGLTVGDTRDHTDMASILRQQDEVIAGIYAARSGREAADFIDLMNAETWLTAEATVAEGLADEVIDTAANTSNSSQRTLHNQIAETVEAVTSTITSAERVVALRAGAGKDLSNVNHESLAGLRDSIGRLDALLNTTAPDTPPEILDRLARNFERELVVLDSLGASQ